MIQKIVDGAFELSCKSNSPDGGRFQGNRALSVSLKISMDTRFGGAHAKPRPRRRQWRWQQGQGRGCGGNDVGVGGDRRSREYLCMGLRAGLGV